MGAWESEAYIAGATLDEAWGDLVKHLQYEYGHANYSGTMKEKQWPSLHDVIAVLDRRVTKEAFERLLFAGSWMWEYETEDFTGTWMDREYEIREITTKSAFSGTPYTRKESVLTKETKRRTLPINAPLERSGGAKMLKRFLQVANGDKWGPPALVEITNPAWRKEIIEHLDSFRHLNNRYKGRRGIRVWYAQGMCSS